MLAQKREEVSRITSKWRPNFNHKRKMSIRTFYDSFLILELLNLEN